ncbi:MAG: energy-coupling factor transporter ATPase [Oscillospiraceae bacterium]|nr:energy-coupling factor transporter ATPase [Oscillospiraceae bacterium]
MSVIIKTENLTHTYSADTPFEVAAIEDINLQIEQGEFVGVIGHTGSGKSTLIQHLNGLLKPNEGKVYIDGEDIFSDKKTLVATRFKVGLVFQYPEYQLFEETVYADIAYGPKNMGLSEQEVDASVKEAAEFVGISPELLSKSPFELSGGQKRRVAIAGVIAMKPKVLILDEPTAGLDPKGRDKILDRISAYHKATGNTIILVSHSMDDIAKYATKVLVMNSAKVFAYDTPRNVFAMGDKLREIGLSTPSITTVFSRLADMGYPVDPNVLTLGEAKQEINRLLNQKQ